jgi:2-iminobutanoate/2-iminopropanoate deaminase
MHIIQTEDAPQAIGPYSQAIAQGDWVFAAGQIPLDPATMEMIKGDVAAQTERVLDNLSAVLEAAGSRLEHVVKTTVFLADMNDFTAMNDVYAKRFGRHKPARSTIQAGALPKGARVEIDAIALKP